MTEINDGSTTYVLPLEDVDLAFLDKYIQKPRTESLPLWPKKRLDGETEYYQVKIVKDTNDGCYIEPSDTYMCYICNIHVPTSCSKQHIESSKHETYKNIFEKVLKRVSKQMNMSFINNIDIEQDFYYCVPCSKVVKKENKHRHESSNYHRQSIEDMKVIKDFYKIFKEFRNDDKGTIEDGSDEDDYNDTESIISLAQNKYDTKNNNSKVYNNNTVEDNGNIKPSLLFPPLNPKTGLEKTDLETMNTKSQTSNDMTTKELAKELSFKEYVIEMIKKYNINVSVPCVEGEFIFIVAPNGDQLKVSKENFQSYIQLKNSIYCLMCNTWISSSTEPHGITEKHVRNIFKGINEKFERTIDTVSSHCIPCNEVVSINSNHHTINDNHKKIIKENLTKFVKYTDAVKTCKTLCEVCNVYIDTHNFTGHTFAKKHINNAMEQNSIVNTENKGEMLCTICNVKMLKNCIHPHINSKNHIAKKKLNCTKTVDQNNKIESNNSTKTPQNDEFGNICNVKVPKGGMDIHTAGKPHKTVLNVKNNSETSAKVNKGNNDKIVAQNDNINIQASTSMPSTIGTLSSVSSSSKLSCENLDLNTSTHSTVATSSKTSSDSDYRSNLFDYYDLLEYLNETDDSNTKVKCKVCDVNIPYLQNNIIEHMEGQNHKIVEEDLLHYHLILHDPAGYNCECCDIKFTNYLEHINSYNHTIKYLDNYVIDKNEMRKYMYEDNTNTPIAHRFRQLYRNLLKHNNIFKINYINYYCAVCHINLSRISEIDHVLGERHLTRMEELDLL